LREAARVLKRGGLLVVTEPAFAALARRMDAAAMGHRRYRRADVVAMCGRAGLHVQYSTYFTSFGFVILLALKTVHVLTRWMHRRESPPAADMASIGRVSNSLMYAAAMTEAALLCREVRLPFGTTVMCVACNPS